MSAWHYYFVAIVAGIVGLIYLEWRDDPQDHDDEPPMFV